MLVVEKSTVEEGTVGARWLESDASQPQTGLGYSKYIIARRRNGAFEPIQAPLPSGDEALPVFVTEQAAWRYLRSTASGEEWYVKESRDGELVSLLMCLCGVKSVLLNPADPRDSGICVDRENFLGACLSGTAGFCSRNVDQKEKPLLAKTSGTGSSNLQSWYSVGTSDSAAREGDVSSPSLLRTICQE